MIRGHFAHFRHDHWFGPTADGTRMREDLEYRAPWGPLGCAAEALFLTRYLRRLLRDRADWIRATAEGA